MTKEPRGKSKRPLTPREKKIIRDVARRYEGTNLALDPKVVDHLLSLKVAVTDETRT